jgi:hypothetical protein
MKRGLELVKMYNGLDREQLYFFLVREFGTRNVNMDIDRLLRMKLVMMKDDEILYIPDTEPNPIIRDAVRILRAFWNKNVLSFNRGMSPVLIRFTKMLKYENCDFCICKDENIFGLSENDRNAMIIVITDNKDLRFPFLSNYLLAVKENDKFNYYKPIKEEPEHEL